MFRFFVLVTQRYLTLWVALCIIAGIAVGQWSPALPNVLGRWEYANVSIPIALLIWLMIYPMMLKVDFQSVKNVGKRPKGILVTYVTNWLIKPFTMFDIAWVSFSSFLKTGYLPASQINIWRELCCLELLLARRGIRMELSDERRRCLYAGTGSCE